MEATCPATGTHPESASEQPRVPRRLSPRRIPLEALDYHLFSPRRAHDRLLEDAYGLWRDVWQTTFLQADGVACVHSDEFARQDEIGVLAVEGRCVSVTGLRWLDMSLSRSREDSYFKHWPQQAMERLASERVLVTSNTVVHPDWRGSVIEPEGPEHAEPSRLAFATIAMSIRRFVASSAESAVGLSRNDRSMNRVAAGLGGVAIARLCHHGEQADIMYFTRADSMPYGNVVDALWMRRHQL